MKNNVNLIISAILLLLTMTASAEIINIPEDHETIQEGINAAERGDTVLVQPGTYIENINFDRKAITVASLFLTTGDIAFIDSTIIDGNGRGSVVAIENIEESGAALVGFTIQNGYGQYGGGVYVCDAAPIIHHLVIRDNTSQRNGGGFYYTGISPEDDFILDLHDVHINGNHSENNGGGASCYRYYLTLKFRNAFICGNTADVSGGGIHCTRLSHILLENAAIKDNSAEVRGGGIFCYTGTNAVINAAVISGNHAGFSGGGISTDDGSELELNHVLVSDNSSGEDGGGLFIWGTEVLLTNVTVVNNEADEVGDDVNFDAGSALTVVNSILWGNPENGIACEEDGIENSITVSYSCIENGQEGVHLNDNGEIFWGEGNIDVDPLFVDPENEDYSLAEDSPCIDAGDPEFPLDPDGSRSDIGASPIILVEGESTFIEGFVYDAEDNRPLQGAAIATSYGIDALTNNIGYFRIVPPRLFPFNITASLEGYHDSTLTNLQIALYDTIQINFSLLYSTFSLSVDSIITELDTGETSDHAFQISNDGTGPLEWQASPGLRGVPELGSIRRSISIGNALEDNRLYGVILIDNVFFVTGWNDGDPVIYVLDADGQPQIVYRQPVPENYDLRDLAWDGELIWGCAVDRMFGFRTNGQVVVSFEIQRIIPHSIAYDPENEWLWVAGTTTDILAYNRNGELMAEIERQGLRKYGLTYRRDDPDGCPLYIIDRNPDSYSVYKVNPNLGEFQFVSRLESVHSVSGAFILDNYDNYGDVLIGISSYPEDEGGDRIVFWQLNSNDYWMLVDPADGVVNSRLSQEISLTIDPTGLVPDFYPGQLEFTNNSNTGVSYLPVDLWFGDPGAVEPTESSLLPLEFAITSVYPNPFNSSTVIRYTLSQSSDVKLTLIDYTGRVVQEIAIGCRSAGYHSVAVDGSDLPTGLYIARLQAGDAVRYTKLVCVK